MPGAGPHLEGGQVAAFSQDDTDDTLNEFFWRRTIEPRCFSMQYEGVPVNKMNISVHQSM